MAVLKFSCLVLAASVAAAASAQDQVGGLEIPSFDYQHLQDVDTPKRILEALEAGGILTLRNIPDFANVRERYLSAAVDCALAMDEDGLSDHVAIEDFADGARRLTLQAPAPQQLPSAAAGSDAFAAKCPGYHQVYGELSRMLTRAVDSFAVALDRGEFRLSNGEKVLMPCRFFGDAELVDQFSALAINSTASGGTALGRDLSLSPHAARTMLTAVVAPAIFSIERDGAARTRRHLRSGHSGLVYRTIDGDFVRPMVRDDELVLVAGAALSQRAQPGRRVPDAVQRMRMAPEASRCRGVGAWFTKTALL